MMPLHELLLLEIRMCLKFMRERTDLARPEHLVDLSWAEVTYANVAGEVVADKVFHRMPGVHDGGVLVDNRAAAGRVGDEGDGPVH